MAEERFTGVVQWFNDAKGFGFIKPDDGGEDLFVHQSSIRSNGFRSLVEGDLVEFSIATGDKEKTKAIDVTGPNGAPLSSKKDNYGGRGRRGGDRRNGGAGCYLCGEIGHLARDCDGGNNGASGGGGGGGACYNCGEVGHLARDCSRGSNTGGGRRGGDRRNGGAACYHCGDLGHLARDCDRGNNSAASGGGGGGACFNCGEVGHLARDCSLVNNTGDGGSGGSGSCFRCGEYGTWRGIAAAREATLAAAAAAAEVALDVEK